jgi:hypothetical protein
MVKVQMRLELRLLLPFAFLLLPYYFGGASWKELAPTTHLCID